MTEHNTQELVAKLRRYAGDVCLSSKAELDAANLIEAQASEIDRLKARATKAEAALATLQQQADRQADEMTDRHHADQAALADMTAARDALLSVNRTDDLNRVICALAEDLGVEPDNEAMHEAIQAIKEARDAALAQGEAMREALEGLADVFEHDCGVDPCAASMAPAEHYLGLTRNALSAPADGLSRELADVDAEVG